MSVEAPYLPYERLRTIAEDFLKQYHPEGTLPVPIEDIIEFAFKLDIVPMPGLKEEFEVDAFITNDLMEIRVDEWIQKHRLNRYRFSLAHELAHLLIHGDVFKALKFNTISEWKEAMSAIPPNEYFYLETQAYGLAGLILVPPVPLADIFEQKVAEARRAGINIRDMEMSRRKYINTNIGGYFEVSADVIDRRTNKDGLWKA